jgi:hypothetical protein
MAISGTVQLSGRVRYAAPVPNLDSSSNPTWLSDLLETLVCSARKEEEFTLITDGDTAINFGSLASAALIVVKVTPNVGIPPTPGSPNGVPATPNPIVVKLTSSAGAAQAIVVDGFLFLLSAGAPYTALSIARAPNVQTAVRIQLFQVGS